MSKRQQTLFFLLALASCGTTATGTSSSSSSSLEEKIQAVFDEMSLRQTRPRHIIAEHLMQLARSQTDFTVDTFWQELRESASVTISILFGSILAVTQMDLLMTVCTGLFALSAITRLFRPLLFASIDPDIAGTRG